MATSDVGIRATILGLAEFRRGTNDMRNQLNQIGAAALGASSGAGSFGRSLTTLGSDISRLGQTMTYGLTLPIVTMTGSLVAAGIQFEDAFAGVSKTVDGISDNFGNLTKDGQILQDQFRQLALEIPISANELSRIGELGGQLGITKTELEGFVETVALLGVTTEMTSESAATFFARLGNIMGVSADQMAEFTAQAGSTVVDLGNKFAATEPEIAALSLRLAGAGQVAGLSTPQILALATAMASLGIQSEMGGSALSRILLELKRATDNFTATGGEATDQLILFAQAAGTTVDAFVELQKNDPLTALLKVIGGFNQMQESGTLTNDMLKEMNFDTVRLQDVLNRLGPNIGLVNEAVSVANEEWTTQDALQIEAQKRFNTTKSQIQLLKNAFVDLGIEIFFLYKDDINKLITGLNNLITSFKEMDSTLLKNIVKYALLAAAIGPLLVVVGTFFQVWGVGITYFTTFTGIIIRLLPTLLALSPILLSILHVFLSFVPLSPLIGGIIYAITNNLFGLGDAFNTVAFWAKTLFSDLITLTTVDEKLKAAWDALLSGDFQGVWDNLSSAFTEFVGFVDKMSPLLKVAWEDIKDSFINVFNNMLTWGKENIVPVLKDIFNTIVAKIVEYLPPIVNQLKEWGNAFINWVKNALPPLVEKLTELVESVKTWIVDNAPIIAEKLKEWATKFVDWARDALPDLLEKLSELGESVINWIADKVPEFISALADWMSAFIEWIGPAIEDILPELGRYAGVILGWLTAFLVFVLPPKLIELTKKFLQWLIDAAIEIGPHLWNFLNVVGNFITNDLIPGAVGFIKEFGKNFVDSLLTGLDSNWGEVEQWFNEKLTWIENQFNAIFKGGRSQNTSSIVTRALNSQAFQTFRTDSPTITGSGSFGGQAPRGVGAGVGFRMRDFGGPGLKNMPYFIGKGAQPELFTPQTNGTFTPYKDLVSMFEKVSRGSYVDDRNQQRVNVFSPNIYGARIDDERSLEEDLMRRYRMATMYS